MRSLKRRDRWVLERMFCRQSADFTMPELVLAGSVVAALRCSVPKRCLQDSGQRYAVTPREEAPMSQQPSASPRDAANVPQLLTELSSNAAAVAEEAEKSGKTDDVRANLRDRLIQEVEWNSRDRQRQFEQAVVWRRWNIGLGLTAGLLTAAAGSVALFAHAPAAIIGLLATFATGSLATLNAGQRKSQSQTAATGYQEIEAFAPLRRNCSNNSLTCH